MTTANGSSYVSTVATNGTDFYQAVGGPAANASSSYRVTDIHYGDVEEQREIERVIN